jgi:hypothetical protein
MSELYSKLLESQNSRGHIVLWAARYAFSIIGFRAKFLPQNSLYS